MAGPGHRRRPRFQKDGTAQGQLGTIDASPRNHFLAIAASMLRNIPSIASARWQSQQKELRDDQAALPKRGSGLFERSAKILVGWAHELQYR